jgi:hypothetical protein
MSPPPTSTPLRLTPLGTVALPLEPRRLSRPFLLDDLVRSDDGLMQVTCPVCGLTFETQATTNTRCRHCRKVINIGVRRGRQELVAARGDTSEHWAPTVLGGALVAGGGYALWQGIKMWRTPVATTDPSSGRGNTWPLWCTFGALLVVAGIVVLFRLS